MKRSEMQHILAGLLSTMYETDQHPEKQLPNAKHIIQVLEELGMKPPLKKTCPVLFRTEHVWEDEENGI